MGPGENEFDGPALRKGRWEGRGRKKVANV